MWQRVASETLRDLWSTNIAPFIEESYIVIVEILIFSTP